MSGLMQLHGVSVPSIYPGENSEATHTSYTRDFHLLSFGQHRDREARAVFCQGDNASVSSPACRREEVQRPLPVEQFGVLTRVANYGCRLDAASQLDHCTSCLSGIRVWYHALHAFGRA